MSTWQRTAAEYQATGAARIWAVASPAQLGQLKRDLYDHIAVAFENGQRLRTLDARVNLHADRLAGAPGSSPVVFHAPAACGELAAARWQEYADAVALVGHDLHARPGPVRDWLMSAPIGALSRATGRRQPTVIQSMYVRKNRWSDPLPPHTDYVTQAACVTQAGSSVQILWLALDPARTQNGCLRMVARPAPSSDPAAGGQPRRPSGSPTVAARFAGPPHDQISLAECAPAECEPGDGILVDGNTVHGSDRPTSGAARDALVIYLADAAAPRYPGSGGAGPLGLPPGSR